MRRLALGDDAIAAIHADVARWGALDVETGCMLLSSVGDDMITVVALAGASGIKRHQRHLHITGEALDPLLEYAEDHDLQLRAQLHSHKHDAFLSEIDKAGNIRMRGFQAAVVPDYAAPPRSPERWGWWQFDGLDWHPHPHAEAGPHRTRLITFDAGGIHEH